MKCVNTGLVFAIALSLVFGANHARAARVDIEAAVIIDPLCRWQPPMLGKADGLPADCMVKARIKTPFFFDPHLQELNKRFIKQILTHRNPYTGLVHGEDPTISFFHIVNERRTFWAPGLEGTSDHWQKMLQARFNTWLFKRYGTRERLAAAWVFGDL